MSDWLKKFKKKIDDATTSEVPQSSFIPPSLTDILNTTINTAPVTYPYSSNNQWSYTTTVAAPTIPPSLITTYGTSAAAAANITGTINIPGSFSIGNINYNSITNIVQFSNNGKEIVKLKADGSVEWANGIEIDEAAEAFSRTLEAGAELAAGITKRVKRDMRDSVFNDLISIAKEKGSLTAEDLTYLLEASKIVEKLKGGKYDT